MPQWAWQWQFQHGDRFILVIVNLNGSSHAIHTHCCPVFTVIFGTSVDTENANLMTIVIAAYRC